MGWFFAPSLGSLDLDPTLNQVFGSVGYVSVYRPGTCLSSFGASTLQKKALFNQNKGHLGSRAICIAIHPNIKLHMELKQKGNIENNPKMQDWDNMSVETAICIYRYRYIHKSMYRCVYISLFLNIQKHIDSEQAQCQGRIGLDPNYIVRTGKQMNLCVPNTLI